MNRILLRTIALAAGAGVLFVLGVFGAIQWRDVADAANVTASEQVQTVAEVVSTTTDLTEIRAVVAGTSAGSFGNLAVHLADGRLMGLTHATGGDLASAFKAGGLVRRYSDSGLVLLRPVRAPDGAQVVVEAFVPSSQIRDPLMVRLGLLSAGGLLAVLVAMAVGYRRIQPLVGAVRSITNASAFVGQGRTGVELPSVDAGELVDLINALNQISLRVEQLIANEREFVADLSHRLRTPLTALRLDSESIGDSPVAQRVRMAVLALENGVDGLIRTAERAAEPEAMSCDVTKVVADRMAFWSVLADHQGRRCEFTCSGVPAWVSLSAKDLGAVVDSLMGNVFQHTLAGTAFAAAVVCHAGWIGLIVEDGGSGIPDSDAALRRGVSGRGSTGLGLDIARQAVEATGGTIQVDRGKLGGARIRLRFAEVGSQHAKPAPKAWRLWSHSANLPTDGRPSDGLIQPTMRPSR